MNQEREAFGLFLRSLREEAHLEINVAAKKLKLAGPDELKNWETGNGLPPMELLPSIATLYRIPYNELLEVWENEK